MTRSHLVAAALLASCGGKAPPVDDAKAAPSLFADADPAVPASPASPAAAKPTSTALHFTATAAQWNLAVKHHAGRNPDRWLPEITGGGVALVDVDRNGALDVLLVDSGDLAAPRAADVGPRLLLGDGRGGFTDATEAWGLRHVGYGMGIAAGDIDADGWTDVYLTSYDGTDRLLRNDGGRGFVDVTATWGITPRPWSTSAAMLDIDGDADLDLYVVRYVRYELATAIKCWLRSIHVYCTPVMYEGQSDILYRNDGGRFVDVSEESGVAAYAEKGLAVGTGDLDDDGDQDLYVANDTSRNLLLLGDGKGHFEDAGVVAGVAYSELGREEASMGVAIADADDDARWDIAVTNFQGEPTSLYMRRPDGNYRERSDAAGIGASSRARLGFGIEFFDADNDGDEDLITANGHVNDNVAQFREGVDFAQLDSLYERVAPGRFVDVSALAGPGLAHRAVSRGLATGDLDGDGGVDVVIVENDGPLHVLRNTSAARGHWLSLWLEGTTTNRSAIGARVTVTVGGRTLQREVRGATSYLSVSDRRVHLGLGTATSVDDIVVRWPDGSEQRLGPQRADMHLRVVQQRAAEPYTPGAGVIAP